MNSLSLSLSSVQRATLCRGAVLVLLAFSSVGACFFTSMSSFLFSRILDITFARLFILFSFIVSIGVLLILISLLISLYPSQSNRCCVVSSCFSQMSHIWFSGCWNL